MKNCCSEKLKHLLGSNHMRATGVPVAVQILYNYYTNALSTRNELCVLNER